MTINIIQLYENLREKLGIKEAELIAGYIDLKLVEAREQDMKALFTKHEQDMKALFATRDQDMKALAATREHACPRPLYAEKQ